MRLPKPDKTTTATILAAAALVAAGAFFLTGRWSNPAMATAEPEVPAKPVKDQADRPRVDVVFALDTTGSMSGLIDSAKKKIWSIANNIVSGQPRPEVRFGLVFYRDKTDEYVTQKVDLTDDIDEVYEHLVGATAAGGGDGPEHVNAALQAAINDMKWRRGDKVLRLVFLVGDAPPHDDYSDTPTSTELARTAAERGIIINTVRAGWDPQTEAAWQRIAETARGAYASIRQDGGTVAVATPYDAELGKYNAALADTSIAWGDSGRRYRNAEKAALRKKMKGEVAASAAAVTGHRGGYMGEDDFISAADKGVVDIATVEGAAAPAALRGKSLEERKQWLADNKAKRAKLAAKVRELSAKRDEFIAKKAKDAPGDSFDKNVNEMLGKQAKAVGLKLK